MAKKNTKTKQPQKRYTPRQTRKFQLRRDHPVDVHVSEILDYSRSKRREVTVIRDGVRLLWALENDDLSVLFEMFPHLKNQFLPNGLNLIEQIQSLLLNTQFLPVSAPIIQQSGPRALKAPTFALPSIEDDDEPTVLIRASTSTDSSMNFVTALRNMQ